MSSEPADLLLVAASARAIAESAVRGGFRVRVLDGFCDLDTQALGPCTRVPLVDLGAGWGLEPRRLGAALQEVAAAGSDLGLVYGSGLESAPEVLTNLPAGLRLLGNDPAVLRLLRDPQQFCTLLDGLTIAHPQTRLDPPPADDPGRWLVKACGGCGGLGVGPWRAGDPRPAAPHLFQRFQEGDLRSILFIADGRGLEVIGCNRLLVADADPRRPFLYGGAIGQAALSDPVRTTVTHWCRSLVGALGLRGLNNLDFILHQGQPYLLDINPRPSATMSLYEGQCEGGWIRRHARACLGDLSGEPPRRAAQVAGQRVVYATADLTIPAEVRWPDWSRDRPAAGTAIARGAPLCTVLAQGPDADLVESMLAARAEEVREYVTERITNELNNSIRDRL
ncbi:ATP-grasp domain-containing protein [uncultured Thiodictyon sp.]|jgi:predicted ATP-grasp superfamily ATP-dependent carboligase|uniref:ATP-grasp domain-containing protein n=1 Tax=uncultured Thiodictyon sp. TaxID=1846217 RepID=UPI0025CBC614|nr:ATP-grasp domain-containing protein [uncultured Thiodictyon sp.]